VSIHIADRFETGTGATAGNTTAESTLAAFARRFGRNSVPHTTSNAVQDPIQNATERTPCF
jgi:hypothetical protein